MYRSSNFGMMKNRVAHTLATALTSETIDANKEFENLISAINKESSEIIINRLWYILPTAFFTTLFAVICLFSMNSKTITTQYWQVLLVLFSANIGGTLSILIGTKKLHFEEYKKWTFYLQFGFERVMLSVVAGTIAYILIRSKLIFPQIVYSDFWKIMSIIIITAFSESLIPSFLGKMEKKA